MLAHIFAITVGLGSIVLYLVAFFFPEVHRKHDFFWSGVGCFYALVLWADAGQISSTELLGHFAAVALIARFSWQTLSLRRKRTPHDLQTPLTDQSWQEFGREIRTIGTNWLKRTPLGQLLPEQKSGSAAKTLQSGAFRASSLKQVDYEFLDDLPPHHISSAKPRPNYGDKPEVALNSTQPAQGQAAATPPTRATAPPTIAQASEKKPTPKSGRGPVQPPKTLLGKGKVLIEWLFEVIGSTARPKPQKPVIVIPPRETSSVPQHRDQPKESPKVESQSQESPSPTAPKTETPSTAAPSADEAAVGFRNSPEDYSPDDVTPATSPKIQPSEEEWDELDNWSEIENSPESSPMSDLGFADATGETDDAPTET